MNEYSITRRQTIWTFQSPFLFRLRFYYWTQWGLWKYSCRRRRFSWGLLSISNFTTFHVSGIANIHNLETTKWEHGNGGMVKREMCLWNWSRWTTVQPQPKTESFCVECHFGNRMPSPHSKSREPQTAKEDSDGFWVLSSAEFCRMFSVSTVRPSSFETTKGSCRDNIRYHLNWSTILPEFHLEFYKGKNSQIFLKKSNIISEIRKKWWNSRDTGELKSSFEYSKSVRTIMNAPSIWCFCGF